MVKKMKWLLPLVFLAACNNENARADKDKAVDEHAGHSVIAGANDYCDSVNNGLIVDDTLKGSPRRTSGNTINSNHVAIEYNSPGVKGRVIWGGLVPYDKVWVTGAHNATSIQFSKEVDIGGRRIPAGKYAFFTIPGKKKWIVILNKRYDQHLADEYSEREDVLRVNAKPEGHEMTPRLTFQVNKVSDKSGEIVLDWEKIRISIPFTVL